MNTKSKKRNIRDYIILIIKGIAMGAADVVPGVSGGTIAFITGIYNELIDSIKNFNLNSVKLLSKGKFKEFWKNQNMNFLLSIFGGIAISLISLAKLLKYSLENHPILIWSFFFGLIIISVYSVGKSIKPWKNSYIIFILLGAILAYIITELSPASTSNSSIFLFLCGALAICAMILPGISGAFILLLLGKYEFILSAVSKFDILTITTVGFGAIVGLLSFSNLLSYLLRKFRFQTIAILTGFMFGSLNKIWPWKIIDNSKSYEKLTNVLPTSYTETTGETAQIYAAIIMCMIGILSVIIIEKLGKTNAKSSK
ncbi:MAG: DUF368 domain-containing protein [Marinifilaceae bacterium]|jgi:putative membrane protein|nr:DUF368 domain-containing protein [Marinifilaceae bacterium]